MLETYLRSTVSDFKIALNAYVYEYLIKSKLTTTASSFLSECNLPTELVNLANHSNEVFLLDWFEVFYSVSKTLGNTRLSDPKIRSFFTELSKKVSSGALSENSCNTAPPNGLAVPPSNSNFNNEDTLKRPGVPDSLKELNSGALQTSQQSFKFEADRQNPQAKKSKPSKAPKGSKAPFKSLTRATAPSSISLPPTNISLSSWAGVESTTEPPTNPSQVTSEVQNIPSESSNYSNVALDGGSVSSYSNKLERELSQSSADTPNKLVGPNQTVSQSQINPTQRFVAEQHAYIRNELKKSHQRAHSLNLQNSSVGVGSLLVNALSSSNGMTAFSTPNAPPMADFQALNLLNKKINMQNIANPSAMYEPYMNNLPPWVTQGLNSQPNLHNEGMTSIPTLPMDSSFVTPDMFNQFVTDPMLFGEGDPNQLPVPSAEDPFSIFNNPMYFDQYPQ